MGRRSNIPRAIVERLADMLAVGRLRLRQWLDIRGPFDRLSIARLDAEAQGRGPLLEFGQLVYEWLSIVLALAWAVVETLADAIAGAGR